MPHTTGAEGGARQLREEVERGKIRNKRSNAFGMVAVFLEGISDRSG